MFRTLCFCTLLATSPMAAAAQNVQEQIIAQLTEQGFREFEIQRTLLGRIRILTTSETLQREMVFNPNTGEILRDFWEPLSGQRTAPQIQIADPSNAPTPSSNRPARPPRPPRADRPLADSPPPRPSRNN